MIKSYSRTLIFLILLIFSFQNVFCQDSLIVRGNVVEFNSNEYIPGVKIELYNGNNLATETYCDINGNFNFFTTSSCDKIVFSFVGFYSTIIENIDYEKRNEFILGQIKLYNRNDKFVTYLTKEAEREDRKEEKRVERE